MGHKGGVAALLKQETNGQAIAVHGVAHVNELAWADALKGELLIEEMLEINQAAYNHYEGSGKKKLSYEAVCHLIGDKDYELVSRHGIRWRESTHRAAKNLLLSWKARCTDLLEEASVEIGLKLTPLSPAEAFLKQTFLKKTDGGEYGSGDLTFLLRVERDLGWINGQQMFEAVYVRVVGQRKACKGEVEEFTKGDLLMYIHTDQQERLYETPAGKLLKRMTAYTYVKTLAYWIDVTAEGKALSKLFQRSNLLLSDVTSGVEDSIASVKLLEHSPGIFMQSIVTDFDTAHETYFGIELIGDVITGNAEYDAMVSSVSASLVRHLNDRFSNIISNPILRAACIFEHVRWPSATQSENLMTYGEEQVALLLSHYSTLFGYLDGNAEKAKREWRRLKLFVMRDEVLSRLGYSELYQRLFDQYSEANDDRHFHHILLLIAIVGCIAVDTSVCERGFSLMNNLKTAKRSRMGTTLLRILMTICSLGAEWSNPTEIPVDEIVNEWRSRSKCGRYEHAMWKAAGLEEPSGRWRQDVQGGATWTGEDDGARAFEGDEAMDNLRAHPQWQR